MNFFRTTDTMKWKPGFRSSLKHSYKDAHDILGLAVKIMWIEVDGASVFAFFYQHNR